MAIPKRVKIGGSYYKGFELDVSAAAGDYVMVISPTSKDFAVNGLSVTPMKSGEGDHFMVEHIEGSTGPTGGTRKSLLMENIYNLGGGVTMSYDFASLELILPGESLRFTYTNVAGVAMKVYITVETVK